MEVRDIKIDKIRQLDNVRLRTSEKDVSSMMKSIKQGDLTGLILEKDGHKYKIYPLDAYDGWGMGYYRSD